MRRGAEETALPRASVDVVFTSPPYFNLELYTAAGESHGETSQSHVKYPTASWWVSQFLARMIQHAVEALRPGGYLLLNVSNNAMLSAGGLNLEGSVVEHARRAGLTQQQTLRMLKPRSAGAQEGWEPIFCFRKPADLSGLVQRPGGGVRGAAAEARLSGSAVRAAEEPKAVDPVLGLGAEPEREEVLDDLVGGW